MDDRVEKDKSLAKDKRLAEEEKWVRRASQGDQGAFKELYERYINSIYSYFYMRVRSKSEAEALASETFTRAIEALLHGDYTWQGKPFGSWLFGVAAKVLKEQIRELSNLAVLEDIDDVSGSRKEPVSKEGEALDFVVQQEERDVLWRLVSGLPSAEQQILFMRYVNGMSYTEIATQLGRSVNACKQIHYRALTHLKRKAHETGLWNDVRGDG